MLIFHYHPDNPCSISLLIKQDIKLYRNAYRYSKPIKPAFYVLRENTTEAYLEILFRKNLSSTETIPLINKANQLAGVYIMRVYWNLFPNELNSLLKWRGSSVSVFISNIFSACLKLGDITSPVSGETSEQRMALTFA